MKTLLPLILITVFGYKAVLSQIPLLYLQAKCIQDNCIAVKWVNETENIPQGFEVLRSEDGIHFKQIGWADGSGNFSTIYTHTDCNVERDRLYYYRLLKVYSDSTQELTDIVVAKVADTCSTGIITIKPNPISQQGKILFENVNHEYFKCVLFDIGGKELKSFETFENEIEITKGPINPGRYFIKLIDARGLTRGVGSLIFK